MLAYILDGVVHEIILEEDPVLPGIPVSERYSPDFLQSCVSADEDITIGMVYEDGLFKDPPEPEPTEDDEDYKTDPGSPTLAERATQLEETILGLMMMGMSGGDI